jgi:hypothetical protein
MESAMAYRLRNCSAQVLRVDLRGGDTLLLAAGALSPVLREELLYDNVFVAQWQQQGWLVRVPAPLGASGDSADGTAPAAKPARKTAPAAAPRKAPLAAKPAGAEDGNG